jgi:hypothetical protein
MTAIQIFAMIFFVFSLSRTILRARDGSLRLRGMLMWVVIWLGLAAIVLYPPLSTRLASLLGIGRGSDLIVYTAVAVLFYLVFRLYVAIEHIEREITALVRQDALDKAPTVQKTVESTTDDSEPGASR